MKVTFQVQWISLASFIYSTGGSMEYVIAHLESYSQIAHVKEIGDV